MLFMMLDNTALYRRLDTLFCAGLFLAPEIALALYYAAFAAYLFALWVADVAAERRARNTIARIIAAIRMSWIRDLAAPFCIPATRPAPPIKHRARLSII